MGLEIFVQYLEVRVCALTRHEAQLHQPAGRIVDEDQKGKGFAAFLEPTVLAAADLPLVLEGGSQPPERRVSTEQTASSRSAAATGRAR